MANPISPQPDPSGAYIAPLNPLALEPHLHIPAFGGELTFNDVQAIGLLNFQIRLINRARAKIVMTGTEYTNYLNAEDGTWFVGKLPYVSTLDPSGYPSEGYNRHGHVNEFDGGAVAGAGNHDHRGAGYGGHSFAVVHPGTDIPLRAYKIE